MSTATDTTPASHVGHNAGHRTFGGREISATLIWHVVLVSGLFLAAVFGLHAYALDRGLGAAGARTVALNAVVVLEIFHLFFIRNLHGTSLSWRAVRGTRVIWLTVGLITAAQFAVTYLPPAQAVLGTRALDLRDGALIVAVGALFFAVIELEKQLRLALRGPPAQR